MTKKIVVLVTFIGLALISANVNSQTPQSTLFNDIIANYNLVEFTSSSSTSFTANHQTSQGKKSSSQNVFACLLNKDVIGYFGLRKKYDTELKQKIFKETKEYAELNTRLVDDYEKAKSQTYYFMVSCRDHMKGGYSLSDKSFPFEWWASDIAYSNFPGYIVFNGLCLTYPTTLISKTTYRDFGSRGARYIQPFRVPVTDEKIAIAIEEEFDFVTRDRWDNFLLVFVFIVEKTENRKTALFPKDFILGKTKEIFFANKKTGQVYSRLHINNNVVQPIK